MIGLLYSCGSKKFNDIVELHIKRKEFAELIYNLTNLAEMKLTPKGYFISISVKNPVEKLGLDKNKIPDFKNEIERIGFLRVKVQFQ
ncbi:MAG: hypothetical protein DRP06_02980 [Candidatus Aenigmatarchaeota archaeon]|nr:MAG: hypothetical protein DRP06_02980 [Candidatus Aenigmarchaeota archaeon]